MLSDRARGGTDEGDQQESLTKLLMAEGGVDDFSVGLPSHNLKVSFHHAYTHINNRTDYAYNSLDVIVHWLKLSRKRPLCTSPFLFTNTDKTHTRLMCT